MKKWTTVLLGAMLTISLSACGNNKAAEETPNAAAPSNAAPTNAAATEATSSPAPAKEAATNGVPTLDELIQKSAEAGKDLKSFAMESQIAQNIVMKQGETKNENKIDMDMKAEYTKDPLQMHQVAKTTTAQGTQDVEQYITADGVYSLVNGAWTKLPAAMSEQLLSTLQQSTSPEKQLEQFKTIAKDTQITEEGDEYLLTAKVSGDSVKELARSLMGSAGGDESQAAILEQMNIKSMNLQYAVSKKTYLPTKTNVDMVMDMTTEGQEVSFDMKMTSTISKHNEIAEIKVPEEALKAKEIEIPAAPATQ